MHRRECQGPPGPAPAAPAPAAPRVAGARTDAARLFTCTDPVCGVTFTSASQLGRHTREQVSWTGQVWCGTA